MHLHVNKMRMVISLETEWQQILTQWHSHIIMIIIWEIFPPSLADGFPLESPQVSGTLLSILADISNAAVWIVSTHPLFSESSTPCNNPLVTVTNVPIKICITITFMFWGIFNCLHGLGIYLPFPFFLVLPCGQPKQQSPLFGRFSFFFCCLSQWLVV